MNGGNSLVVMFLICKSWLLEFLVKRLLLSDANIIGVYSNVYIPRKEIGWSIKGLMTWFMFITIYGCNIGWLQKKSLYDPIDYECIDKTEFWVVEEEVEGELAFDELESMLEEQPRISEESTNFSKDDMVTVEEDDNAMIDVGRMTSNDLDEEDWLTSPPKN
ncbi:uncharacterized protein LOC120276486 isoform X2 [Dioscorea cayenensis subsp. rotundata]|uniref:Uncharacterized protein LOC120276486 isoform X2 n=1 Tax=Dioscorea cayennensis subsp. rotundata TaxID=55577 RepID=A0AB40CIC5_DIOCR|nr:uncharacterized protein LOC120276486 isoform X2 [Dioscorea cayenensis subsp. rotundata]